MLVRTFRTRQVSDQISGRSVKAYALEVVELLSLEIEDLPTDHLANMKAIAVEYVSVHGWPPLRWWSLDKMRQPIVNSEGFTRIATRLAGGTVSALANPMSQCEHGALPAPACEEHADQERGCQSLQRRLARPSAQPIQRHARLLDGLYRVIDSLAGRSEGRRDLI